MWKNEAVKKYTWMILTPDLIKHTGKDNWIPPRVFTVIIIYLLIYLAFFLSQYHFEELISPDSSLYFPQKWFYLDYICLCI